MKAWIWFAVACWALGTASDVDVCVAPFPAMPLLLQNEDGTSNGNGLSCYECEIMNTTEVSNTTCNVTQCTGTGGSGPACYRWEFTYKGINYNTIRTGCAVNCSWVDYETHMCSGVGEVVFDTCAFAMCKDNLCNEAARRTIPLLLLLSSLLFLGI